MGNKSGKFDVPVTSEVKKDEAVINETGVTVEETHNGTANGDEIKQEVVATESNETPAAPKKKNMMSWLKKMSIRKEKKPKAAKTNGVKEEVVETAPKENGEVAEVPHVEENGDAVIENGHNDCVEAETVTKESTDVIVKEEVAPECHENGVETTETVEENHLTNEAE